MKVESVRHLSAPVLVLIGVCISIFSLPVAFGWGRKGLSIPAMILAVIGYICMLLGHWLLRDSDWQVLFSFLIKWILLLQSMLLLAAVFAIAIHPAILIPYGYLVFTGCFSLVCYWRFRKHIETSSVHSSENITHTLRPNLE
jgi:hypothetical protein